MFANALRELITIPNSFTLLLAPPGWGKTRLLKELYPQKIAKLVFVSPLRALANELAGRFNKSSILIKSQNDLRDKLITFIEREESLLILTPELLNDELLTYLSQTKIPIIVDELHLYFIWGAEFRPLIWERLLELAITEAPILGLTATMNHEILNEWKRDFLLQAQNLFLIQIANNQFHYWPRQYHYYSPWFPNSKKLFNRTFIRELKRRNSQTFIYFCRFRHEVGAWLTWCENNNISAIGCVGGETSKFSERLANIDKATLQVIFSTSCLSHGVNLPPISKVFINYPLLREDFWIQFCGRGGREGNDYEVYTFDSYFQTPLSRISSFLKCHFSDMFRGGILN